MKRHVAVALFLLAAVVSLAASLESVVQALAAAPSAPLWPKSGGDANRGRASAEAAKRALASFWHVE